MAKTLTDRTSVRVTAKSETDANNQKKNDANNIAKALGKDGDLDDTKASSVASKLGNTITDENGTTWAKSSEVAAAAKELDGEFKEENWDRYTGANYDYYRLSSLFISNRGPNVYAYEDETYIGDMLVYKLSTSYSRESISIIKIPDTDNKITSISQRYDTDGVTPKGDPTSQSADVYSTSIDYDNNIIPTPALRFNTTSTDSAVRQAYYLGVSPTESKHSGGSKVDTSKSEDQIKDEIESKAWAQGKAAKINPIEPNETYIAVTDANGNPLYFLGT